MRAIFVFLSIMNFVLFVFAAVSKIAQQQDPRLYDSPWAGVFAVYAIGCVLTWPVTLLAGIIQAMVVAGSKPASLRSMYCRKCEYILEGLVEHRCPECGQPFDPDNVVTFRRYLKDPRDRQVLLAWLWLAVSGIVIGWFILQFLKFMFP